MLGCLRLSQGEEVSCPNVFQPERQDYYPGIVFLVILQLYSTYIASTYRFHVGSAHLLLTFCPISRSDRSHADMP